MGSIYSFIDCKPCKGFSGPQEVLLFSARAAHPPVILVISLCFLLSSIHYTLPHWCFHPPTCSCAPIVEARLPSSRGLHLLPMLSSQKMHQGSWKHIEQALSIGGVNNTCSAVSGCCPNCCYEIFSEIFPFLASQNQCISLSLYKTWKAECVCSRVQKLAFFRLLGQPGAADCAC